jgi:hypothetical protein
MSYIAPKIDSFSVHLSNPKDILVSRCRSMMLDIAIKQSYNTESSPTYYTGVAVQLENSLVVDMASEVPFINQISGDYNG